MYAAQPSHLGRRWLFLALRERSPLGQRSAEDAFGLLPTARQHEDVQSAPVGEGYCVTRQLCRVVTALGEHLPRHVVDVVLRLLARVEGGVLQVLPPDVGREQPSQLCARRRLAVRRWHKAVPLRHPHKPAFPRIHAQRPLPRRLLPQRPARVVGHQARR